MATDLRDRVLEIIAGERKVEASTLLPDAKLIEELGFDSLDLLDLVCRVEDELQVEVPDEELRAIVTVADTVAMIERLVAARETALAQSSAPAAMR